MNGNYSKLIEEINQLRSKNIRLKAMEFYYIERKTQSLITNEITRDIVLLNFVEFLYLSNILSDFGTETAVKLIEECHKIDVKERTGQKHFVLGALYKTVKDAEKSLQHFQQAIVLTEEDDTNDSHLTPYSTFELAAIYIDIDPSKANHLLNDAAAYTDYDLENRLRLKIHHTKTQLNNNH